GAWRRTSRIAQCSVTKSPCGTAAKLILHLKVTEWVSSALYVLGSKELGDLLADAESAQELVTALVASHGTQLRRFVFARARNVADAPDIVQEVYLRMLRISNTESIRSPEAYLFTVAQHVVQQHSMRQSATPSTVQLAQLLNEPAATHDADPGLALEAQQCLEGMQLALEELSPKARATFMLHRRDGLSFDEIAARLETSRPMVKKYLMKALLHLRLRLQQA
ncbi:MAG TPA: RNA polymerase sigma factor, partial [Candidatus Saccharimonadales bacterium]|nr:RNA polymerase sigma factor [Candidatus Saccharimonadales bacterium]